MELTPEETPTFNDVAPARAGRQISSKARIRTFFMRAPFVGGSGLRELGPKQSDHARGQRKKSFASIFGTKAKS
jgi:hypothetical protein